MPVRVIAFYLPQFHPIPENDAWWGKGFTEWTNTVKARPLFPGHYQPHLPSELGFYDLRVPETRATQARLAAAHGVSAFCYYHYWFAGRRLLQRPFEEVLASGEPDFPFCLCWANQSWTGVWHGAPDRVLVEQTYPGEADHVAHFNTLLPAFRDRRYLRVEGKPLFCIYAPTELPNAAGAMALWRRLAQDAGLPGLHLVGCTNSIRLDAPRFGLDAVVVSPLPRTRKDRPPGMPTVHEYGKVAPALAAQTVPGTVNYPCVIPNWDNTPRAGVSGMVLHNSTPDMFRRQLQIALERARSNWPEQQVVFVKSWNEWAEGNHLEPDQAYGRAYLEVVREMLRMTAPQESATAKTAR